MSQRHKGVVGSQAGDPSLSDSDDKFKKAHAVALKADQTTASIIYATLVFVAIVTLLWGEIFVFYCMPLLDVLNNCLRQRSFMCEFSSLWTRSNSRSDCQ